jgi:hypothetical protein
MKDAVLALNEIIAKKDACIAELEAENLRLQRELAVERGNAWGAPEGWVEGSVGGRWMRVLRHNPMTGNPVAWLWVADDLGTVKDGEYYKWAYGLTDLSLHEGEHNPWEISEWWHHAKRPLEAMELADEKFQGLGSEEEE